MALTDIIAKLSPNNDKSFHHDPDACRRPVLERIARNRMAFADASKKVRGGKWFDIGNNKMVALTPTRQEGQPIVIDGQSVTFRSSEEISSNLDAFEAAVRAGPIAREQLLTVADWPGRVEPTNACERDLRPAVIQRKITNGYRAMWAALGEVDVRTVVATARLTPGTSTFGTIAVTLAA